MNEPLILLMILMDMPAISAQELYRSVDQGGRTTYTDNPAKIPAGAKGQPIEINLSSANFAASHNPNHFFTPFTLDSGHILVEVGLANGEKRRKAKLVFDTGAPGLVIHRRIATELNLRPLRIVLGQISDGEKQKITNVAIAPVTLKLGPLTMDDFQTAWHMDKDYLGPPWGRDGLLGMSVIRQFDTRIDYEKKQIEWRRRKTK